jgi:hypothetical protein
MKKLIKVGPKHWARANQIGEILESNGERFRVRFEKEGIGIYGHELYLTENDFTYAKRESKRNKSGKGLKQRNLQAEET